MANVKKQANYVTLSSLCFPVNSTSNKFICKFESKNKYLHNASDNYQF